ncbi:MAG: 50S ribosomal protein L5 [Bacteroidia bacterium]|jgi:large subunit ribosomal protein L5|nr:50S ribosomal protein L5 [Bacteroidia bacterium]MCF8427808.1 50S ribosomal protein L5 [Bacteroidia bacterium]MCF8446046.1 50S ribosomal protein L5 [Bacteroidia bacterium]
MYTPRLKEKYAKQIIPAMQEKFGYKNSMMVPKLLKICINQGIGQAVADKKLVDQAIEELSMIAGQRAVGTRSKKDISNFKLRKNVPIGTRVTLRGDRMYEFLDRLISISLPRVRDFQGLKLKGFDGRGNYNMGVTEQIIFAEIVMEKVNRINGMDIAFVTTATNDEQCLELLKEFGFPFKKS